MMTFVFLVFLMCPLWAKETTPPPTATHMSQGVYPLIESWWYALASKVHLVDKKDNTTLFKPAIPPASIKAELSVNNFIMPELNARLGIGIHKNQPVSVIKNKKTSVRSQSPVKPSFLVSMIYYFSPQKTKNS